MTESALYTSQLEEASLGNCDKEPIHIPGTIQGFAVLLATDKNIEFIEYCSDNTEDLFGCAAGNLLGRPLNEFISPEVFHELRNVLSLSTSKTQRERVTELTKGDKAYEVWVHLSEERAIIEFEQRVEELSSADEVALKVRSLLARLSHGAELQRMFDEAVIGLRQLSGYDRVMLYKFDQSNDGEIIAESRSASLEPFLGLRFPSYDIPKQARKMLVQTPVRMIIDVDYVPIKLLTHLQDNSPLDLSIAFSRGISTIHCDYLRNMGVASSMTLSVVIQGKLWGLFAFHHSSARNIGPALRGAADLFTQFFSLQLEQRLKRDRNVSRSAVLEHQSALMEAADIETSLAGLVEKLSGSFTELVNADGMAVFNHATISSFGQAPSEDCLRRIFDEVIAASDEAIVATDNLSGYGIEALPTAGVLAFRLSDSRDSAVAFFRNEAMMSVDWAGNPKKEIVEIHGEARLQPRASFAHYSEQVKGRCTPWDESSVYLAEQIRIALTRADSAMFRRLTYKEERQRSIYIAELNHRVRNILSLVRSLSRRTHSASRSLEEYARAMERRINALGAAHDLATSAMANGLAINQALLLEAAPFTADNGRSLHLSGDSYVVDKDVAPIFALIVHELMTNCNKYGSFSTAKGTVFVDVLGKSDGVLIRWREAGGPEPKPGPRRGFGLELIENAIPYELEGESTVEYLPEGLQVSLWLPSKFAWRESATSTSVQVAPAGQEVSGAFPERILVVEDSMMLAIDMSDMLTGLGAVTVDKCATVTSALSTIEKHLPDFAVLDVCLRGEFSFGVAEVLLEHNVPFLFSTGYGSDYPIPDGLQHAPLLTKPVKIAELREHIKTLYGSDRS